VTQHAIRAGFCISHTAWEPLVLAETGNQRLGTHYDQHRASGFARSELSLKFLYRHKFLAAADAQAAVFWGRLVFDDDCRDTGRRITWSDIG
jgi:hypothetical protein